ncbi:MAG: serine/threonine protein kinase, partial [Myxococcales bacterium]
QQVAIKILHKEVAESAEAMTRFMREGQAAARLRSTHAARVLDVGRLSSGMPYLVMEYLNGKDLSQVLEERGPLALQEAVDYLLQTCEAVADAHSLGIVHRDLKPANLFLTLDPFGQKQIKVLDFGISKWSTSDQAFANTPGSMTNTAVVMGSPLYMPPEQMRSARAADERSDIWALGTILWELLTGRHIWEAETMSAICMRVASDPTPSLCAARTDLPVTLDAVIAECLQKEPARRYQSVLDFALALAPFGGSNTSDAISRIRHFSGGTPTTISSSPVDSAVLAQTPLRLHSSASSSQPQKLGTVTPDTWLSGSDPNLSMVRHGSVKRKLAVGAGVVAALVAAVALGFSWRGAMDLDVTTSRARAASATAAPNNVSDAASANTLAPDAGMLVLPTAATLVLPTAATPSNDVPPRSSPQPLSAKVNRPRPGASVPSIASAPVGTSAPLVPTPREVASSNTKPGAATAHGATPDWGGRL